MRNYFPVFLFVFFLKSSFLSAQVPYFQEYYPLRKNQPVEVNTIFQDSKGFVWFGSHQGLFRFDGSRYRQYKEADTVKNIRITALAEDSLGRIWAGDDTGQLSYLEDGKLQLFETDEGAAGAPISDIVFGRDGTLWFSTMNDGLYYYVKERLYRVDEAEGLPDLFIYDLYEDERGRIWAGTDGGIAICSLNERTVSIEVVVEGLPDIIVKKIKFLNRDTLSIATEDAGVINFNPMTRKFKPLVRAGWRHGSISDFVIKENQFWISCPRNGIIVYDRQTGDTNVLDQFGSLSLRSVNALMKDREGNIWSGTKTGLSRTLGNAVEHIETLNPAGDLNIVALTVDLKDRIWFSTSGGLFMRSDGKDGIATVTRKLANSAFGKSTIISLYADARGFIWAGLYGNGLLQIDPETNQVRHFRDELRNGNILNITGKGDLVWVATLGGSTSIEQDGQKYVVKNYSSEDGLSSDYIYQVFIDSKDRAWFATDGKGVSMLDGSGFHHYRDGLQSGVVYSIAEDSESGIWVTSQNNGIYHLEGQKFVPVSGMRLRDNSIQALVADNDGNLVAIHNYGIDVYNTGGRQVRYFGEETGIRDKLPNLNAVAKDRFGQLYFGTSKGIIKFSLRNDHDFEVPRAAIDAVTIYGEPVDISVPRQLKYNEDNMTIHFVGFWYQNVESLNYQYKLENYDLEWITTRNEDVTYSRLPPGDYVFKVKVSASEDYTNAQESSFSFSISPPFWRTSTFYFFVVAAILIGAYSLMKFRERKLLEDKLELEAKVEERTKEIQQKTEEIQAQNEEILAQAEEIQGINENLEMLVKQRTAELEKKNKALEEYAFINAHKLRSPVASILGLLNLLSKTDLKGEDSKVIREHLQNSADKLDEVVRSITKAIEKADNRYL